MTTENSHGKARTTLVRSSDLGPMPDADAKRPRQRDAKGRFTGGNDMGRGKGAKRAIRALMGGKADEPIAAEIAASARVSYFAKLRELPHDGAIVSAMVAMACRHEALYGFWQAEAARVGLTTPEGVAAQDQATKHGQRAERLMVTATDLAKSLAAGRKPDAIDPLAAYMPPRSG